jgi:hypothetical protein
MFDIIMTRGVKHDSERFANELSSQYVPYMWFNPETKKLEQKSIQIGVQPIQLYKVFYPEAIKDVMRMTLYGKGKGETQHKKHKAPIAMVRKMLGVKPIPMDYSQERMLGAYKSNVEITPIGYGEDYYVNGQEML